MRIAYTEAQTQLRDTLRAYFAELVTPEVVEEMSSGEFGGPGGAEQPSEPRLGGEGGHEV